MEARKKVLLVDGDEILREGIHAMLNPNDYHVIQAADSISGQKLLAMSHFDLVITNSHLPGGECAQLITVSKAQEYGRVLVVCPYKIEDRELLAVKMGVDGILSEPFSKSELQHAVASALRQYANSDADGDIVEYVPVPMHEFLIGSILTIDLFIHLRAREYFKVGSRGQILSPDGLETFVTKGSKWFYVRKLDFAAYVGFRAPLITSLSKEDRVKRLHGLRLAKAVTGNVIDKFERAGLEREQTEHAMNVVMNAVELLMTSPKTLNLLEMIQIDGLLPESSIVTAIWACLIAKRMGWICEATYFKIALSALFHNIGEIEIAPGLRGKPRLELKVHELHLVESHTIRGRDILQAIPGMPEEVATVALQHHERMQGGGYPHNLRFEQIHPLARLIAISSQFSEIAQKSYAEGETISLNSAYELLCRNRSDFDSGFLRRLAEIISYGQSGAVSQVTRQ